MAEYNRPDVYIEELEAPTRPLASAGTSTLVFIGQAESGVEDAETLITSWAQYKTNFGEFDSPAGLLPYAVYNAFNNGAKRMYIINVDLSATPSANAFIGDQGAKTGIYALEDVDEILTVCVPDAANILDDAGLKAVYEAYIAYAEIRKDMFILVDTIDGKTPTTVKTWLDTITASRYIYKLYPWITMIDPATSGGTKDVPASSWKAGKIAKVDAEKGPWISAAGTDYPLNGVSALKRNVIDSEQDVLNPVNINCIRYFTGYGNLIWGARTSSSDTNWRYTSVVRTHMLISKTILQNTKWVVFKPNDEDLWRKIRISLNNYLTGLWRLGALKGNSPDEAFYVKCDADLNTQAVIDAGQVIIEVGCAYQKPAEFVIFRIGQWDSGSSVT